MKVLLSPGESEVLYIAEDLKGLFDGVLISRHAEQGRAEAGVVVLGRIGNRRSLARW
jgi:hypothetical protein